MIKKVFLIIILLCINESCQDDSLISKELASPKKTNKNVTSKTQQLESEIYGIVLEHYKTEYGSGRILIVNETTPGSVSPDNSVEKISAFLEKKLPSNIPKKLIENFREVNEMPHNFQVSIDTDLKYAMFEKAYLSQVEDDNSINNQPLEGGIVNLSRIGFSQDEQSALVYISYWNGSRTGWGYYTVLVKKEDQWVISDKILAWVS